MLMIPAICENCDRGFRRVQGIHIGSQRLGMIPNAPCKRVGVVTDPEGPVGRRFAAHIDGALLRNKDGEIRRFATATAAARAARVSAPKMWHP
jgi:hypothetical protein